MSRPLIISKLDYDFAEKFNFNFFKDNKYTKYSIILNVNTFDISSWISEYMEFITKLFWSKSYAIHYL